MQLAQEIERQQHAKRDYLAPTKALTMTPKAEMQGFNGDALALNNVAHDQVGTYLNIPAKYYDRMLLDDPSLLAHNVNTWMQRDDGARMVRTLDGNIRAFLSDRYRPLENGDLAEAVLPVLGKLNLEILSCEITDRRLYLKAVDKSILKDIPSGKKMGNGHTFFDTLSPAIVISNSEVGLGALSVETAVWTHLCTNLAIAKQQSLRKYHVGSKHELTDGLYEMLSDKTKRLSDAATWAQVSDVVQAAFNKARFDATCTKLGEMSAQPIKGDVVKVVELAAKQFTLNQTEQSSVLRHLIEGGDLTRYGLFNAVTRTAEDIEQYDRATELEKLGGHIVELPRDQWSQIADAVN